MLKLTHLLKITLLIFGFTFTQTSTNAQTKLFSYNTHLLNTTLPTLNLVSKNINENKNTSSYSKSSTFISNSLGLPKKAIVITNKHFKIKRHYFDKLLSSERYNGNLNEEGVYYLKGKSTEYYKIYYKQDLNTDSDNYTFLYTKETLSKDINIDAWAFNKKDNYLYSVEKNTNHLYKINPDTNKVVDLGEISILSGFNYNYDEISFDPSGFLYVRAKQPAKLYILSVSLDF